MSDVEHTAEKARKPVTAPASVNAPCACGRAGFLNAVLDNVGHYAARSSIPTIKPCSSHGNLDLGGPVQPPLLICRNGVCGRQFRAPWPGAIQGVRLSTCACVPASAVRFCVSVQYQARAALLVFSVHARLDLRHFNVRHRVDSWPCPVPPLLELRLFQRRLFLHFHQLRRVLLRGGP